MIALKSNRKWGLRVLRPGGILSSLGVYSSDLKVPLDAFSAGLGDNAIVTALSHMCNHIAQVIADQHDPPTNWPFLTCSLCADNRRRRI